MAADIIEYELTGPWRGFTASPPAGGGRAGVLVLSGSSGRIERERCRLFARAGVSAATVRWFGGPGQPPGICELPLEILVEATGLLRERGAERVSILGLSKSAEAALLVSTLSDCADAVIALAPSSVVWANVGPGHDGRHHPYRSSWTWQGHPLPFVPYTESRLPPQPPDVPVALLDRYESSLTAHPDRLGAAAIPIENTDADLVLVAGGADRMWPSLRFAHELADRRTAAGRETTVITHSDAGHRITFPDETPPPPSTRFDHGGTPQADAALGTAAWPHIMTAVHGN